MAQDNEKLASIPGANGSGVEKDPERPGSRRDPEERRVDTEHEQREKAHDKTLADSFPTSDPPSTIPDPAEDENAA